MHIAEIPTTTTPLPAPLAAVWGAFLFEGLFIRSDHEARCQAVLDCWGQGCVELVTELCALLPELWRQAAARWEAEDADLPGVFEYEVVSELGAWFGDFLLAHAGRIPAPGEVCERIGVVLDGFFAQGRAVDSSAPDKAVPAVTREVA